MFFAQEHQAHFTSGEFTFQSCYCYWSSYCTDLLRLQPSLQLKYHLFNARNTLFISEQSFENVSGKE